VPPRAFPQTLGPWFPPPPPLPPPPNTGHWVAHWTDTGHYTCHATGHAAETTHIPHTLHTFPFPTTRLSSSVGEEGQDQDTAFAFYAPFTTRRASHSITSSWRNSAFPSAGSGVQHYKRNTTRTSLPHQNRHHDWTCFMPIHATRTVAFSNSLPGQSLSSLAQLLPTHAFTPRTARCLRLPQHYRLRLAPDASNLPLEPGDPTHYLPRHTVPL